MADDTDAGPSTAEPSKPCPICGKPAQADYRPFCSKRCADVDLNRWLSGRYALPADPDPNDQLDRDNGSDDF